MTRNLDARVPSNQVADMIGDTLAMVEMYRGRRVEGQRAEGRLELDPRPVLAEQLQDGWLVRDLR